MLQEYKAETADRKVKMSLLPVIKLLDYNLFILRTARMSSRSCQQWQDIIWQCRSKWPWLLWGCACLETAQKPNADCCYGPLCPMEEWGDGLLTHRPMSWWEERWAAGRDFNLTDIQRAQAASAKTPCKYFVIIDSNLLTQEALDLAENSVFDLLMGKEKFVRNKNKQFAWVQLLCAKKSGPRLEHRSCFKKASSSEQKQWMVTGTSASPFAFKITYWLPEFSNWVFLCNGNCSGCQDGLMISGEMGQLLPLGLTLLSWQNMVKSDL